MQTDLRRTGAISAGLHVALLLALLVTLKPPVVPKTDEAEVTMEFAPTPGETQRSTAPADTPSPAPADVATPDLPSMTPPKPAPTEAPAPPPPPPLPPPPAPPQPAPTPPLPTPPIPPPPTPAPAAPSAPVSVAPAPATTAPAENPLPRPPVPTPPKPAPTVAPAPSPPKPAAPAPPAPPRPAPERPTPTQPTTSTTSQPNPAKNTADNSKALEATLERLRSLQTQNAPPRAAYNPPRGGAPGGGSPNGVDNAKLSAADRGAIGAQIRECYSQDTGGRDYAQQWALVRVTTDGSGVVRLTDIVSHSPGAIGQVFAERAARAARDPQCAKLPLPGGLLGQNHVFEITFKP